MPIFFSLLGVCVTTVCMYVIYRAATAWYRRRFVEALVEDIKASERAEAKRAEVKDSIG